MRRTFHRLASTLLTSAAGALILLAVLSLATRLLLPHADGLREAVVSRLAETLGVEVEVGTLALRLRGLSPELSFSDAQLIAPGSDGQSDPQVLLRTRALRVEVDPFASLAAQRPRIESITLVGAEIQVARGRDGRIRVLGLDKMQGDDIAALDFFLHQGRFRLLDSRLIWRDQRDSRPLAGMADAADTIASGSASRFSQTFLIEVAELNNDGRSHRLRLRVRPDVDPTGEIQVLAALEGPAETPAQWSGRIYLGWLGTDIGAYGLGPAGVAVGVGSPTGGVPVRDAEETGSPDTSRLDAGAARPGLVSPTALSPTALSPTAVSPRALDIGSEDNGAPGTGWLSAASSTFQLESWNRLVEGRLQESLSRIAVSDLTVAAGAGQRRHPLGELSGLARWQRDEDGWQLDIADLRWPGTEKDRAATAALVRYQRRPSASATAADPHPSLFATFGEVPLRPVGETLALITPRLPGPVASLVTAGIGGQVHGLALHLRLSPTALGPERDTRTAADRPGADEPGLPAVVDWRLRGELEDLRIDPGGAIPPIAGLDLSAELGPDGGRAEIDAADVELDLRPFFALAHRFTELRGKFAWRRMPAGSIHLWTPALRADTANVETLTRLSLCAHPSGASPFLNLQTHLRNGRISGLRQWLPAGVMDDRLEDWLQRAIVAGRVESGDLLLRGALDQFPFDDNQGRFLLVLRAVDGTLDYGVGVPRPAGTVGLRSATAQRTRGWPPLRDIAATLRFENRRLEIEVPSASILNTQVESGQARLANLWQPRYLEIEARGEGPLEDGLHVLSTTPLADQLGGLASAVEVDGRSELGLDLGVPLTRGLPFRYAGELTLGDGKPSLQIKGSGLRFTDISGQLQFDANGVAVESITANLGDQPVEVDVKTSGAGTPAAHTEIGLSGQTAIDRFAETLPDAFSRLMSGELDWRLLLALSNRDAVQPDPPIDFDLTSSLRGLAVKTPPPFGKSIDETRRFQLSGRYQAQWPLSVSLRYGALGALLELHQAEQDEVQVRRAAVGLDRLPSALPPPGRLSVSGRLERLDLDAWQQWAVRTEPDARRDSSGATKLELLPVQLQVDELRFGAWQLNGLEALITPEPEDAWTVALSADQTGSGRIRLPPRTGREPIQARLEKLDIAPLVGDEADGSAPRASMSTADPSELGGWDIEIEQLHYGEDLLGRLRILTAPQPDGLRLTDLSLQGPHVQASGNGQWRTDATDFVETAVEIEVQSDAAGELLRESGFYSALSGAPGKLSLDLAWPGGPTDLSLASARGGLNLEIGAGRMLEMEPGVGRMLGILNTSALRRRLSLDFSDVFEDGFSFDSIRGEIGVRNGEARIRNLEILAPPADIQITGQTNLVEGLLDQRVEVTPKIGTGLALAGAVAGGPVLGAAVFLADKVTDGGVERLGRYAYRVEGPWRDPTITRIGTSGSPAVGDLLVSEPDPDGSTSGPTSEAGGQRAPTDEKRPSSALQRERSPAAEQPDNPFLEGF